MWSTYFNPLLTAVLSKTKDNILLRWTNKAAESYTSKRPDAIINALSNNKDLCLGYGECKLGSVSKKELNMDIVKLTIFTQRAININNEQNVFSYSIEGFKVNFFVTSIENEHVHICNEKNEREVTLPRCIDGLPFFINMKTINDILQITKYFWELRRYWSSQLEKRNPIRSLPRSCWYQEIDCVAHPRVITHINKV